MDDNTMRKLIRKADVRTLEELILCQCREDVRFYLEALSCLGGSSEDEYLAVKCFVEDSIERNVYRGQLNKSNCVRVCNAMITGLNRAQYHLGQKRYAQAMDIAFYILQACIDLINRTGNTSNSVWNIFGSSSEILSKCTTAVQRTGSTEEKRSQAARILSIAKNPAMLPWRDLRRDLLEQALPLANEEFAEEILALLTQES